LLWARYGTPTFNIDGIVELRFSGDDAMRSAQASDVGRRYIPADEPHFLRGWTLCVVDTKAFEPQARAVKVIVPFQLVEGASRERFAQTAARAGAGVSAHCVLNWTESTARREKLWCESTPPDGFAVFWFETVAAAHKAFDTDSMLCTAFDEEVVAASAFLIDEITIL
jgi:hypothetical protein